MAKKLKRIKLGRKESVVSTKKMKDSTYYPSIYISNKKLPIEPEDVGKILSATVQLKVVGVNMRTDEDAQNFNYDFEVREIVFTNKGNI